MHHRAAANNRVWVFYEIKSCESWSASHFNKVQLMLPNYKRIWRESGWGIISFLSHCIKLLNQSFFLTSYWHDRSHGQNIEFTNIRIQAYKFLSTENLNVWSWCLVASAIWTIFLEHLKFMWSSCCIAMAFKIKTFSYHYLHICRTIIHSADKKWIHFFLIILRQNFFVQILLEVTKNLKDVKKGRDEI